MKKHLSAPPIPVDETIWTGSLVSNGMLKYYDVPECTVTPVMIETNILSGDNIKPGSTGTESYTVNNDNDNWF